MTLDEAQLTKQIWLFFHPVRLCSSENKPYILNYKH